MSQAVGNLVKLAGVLASKKTLVTYGDGASKPKGHLINFVVKAGRQVGDNVHHTYVGCVAFGDNAMVIEETVAGDALAVTGYLNQSKWKDKTTGLDRYKMEVIANEVTNLSRDVMRKATNSTEKDVPSHEIPV